MHLLFIYNSLKTGAEAHGLLEGAFKVGWAALPKHALYICGKTPVATENPIYTVYGELWVVNPAQLVVVDQFVGATDLFSEWIRTFVTVDPLNTIFRSRDSFMVEAYIFRGDISGAQLRRSGVY